ncbi:MAG: substrate-binding domain-containing protein [Defluviitaleaceae bacterium]|nr:substrate-binding domain-containing protein [Defluviitaleaceae bacterium]
MNLKKYYICTTLMALLVSPAIVGVGGVLALFSMGIGALLALAAVVLVWVLYLKRAARREMLPANLSQALLPIFISFAYYMLVWLLLFGISGYSYDVMNRSIGLIMLLTLPYLGATFILGFVGMWVAFPIMYGVVTLLMLIPTLIVCRGRKVAFDKGMWVGITLMVCLVGTAAFQFHARSLRFIGAAAGDVQLVGEEVNMQRYRPFPSNNYLVEMPWEPAIVFTENFPRLDGATAAYPVFAAMAQALFEGLDAQTVSQYVSVSQTDRAYERLINGEIDIFFGAQPSGQHIAEAQAKGIEFTMTPIAREAFVFFVHRDNPVNSLTLTEIQDIYRRRITNWRQVGGQNERILAFQRPENSGSQTMMLAAVMGDIPIMRPLQHERISGMGGVIANVATYRNYSSAIGYSFRYFVTGMRPHDDIKLLAIDGVAPTPENIRNGTYPLTMNVYAVTAGTTNENAAKLIDWILSDQGQAFIELCGIVSIGD